jgi:hypothetical protein
MAIIFSHPEYRTSSTEFGLLVTINCSLRTNTNWDCLCITVFRVVTLYSTISCMVRMVRLVRCYTCNLVFDIDKSDENKEAKEHSRSCHEMTLGFRA